MFTDIELATMHGGHSLYTSSTKGKMSFIKELKEARLLYSVDDLKSSYSDTCENLYLSLLALELAAHCKETQSFAKKYASETVKWGVDYREFRSSANDLYNLIYLVQAEPSKVEKIFKSEDARKLRERTQLPVLQLNGYLTSLTIPNNRDIYFLMRVEQALSIKNSNSKEIRRLLSYKNPTDSDVKQLAYRVLNEFRNRLSQFDLLPDLERQLSKDLTFDR